MTTTTNECCRVTTVVTVQPDGQPGDKCPYGSSFICKAESQWRPIDPMTAKGEITCNLDGDNYNKYVRIIDQGSIKMVWYPLLDGNGTPELLRPGIDTVLRFQFNERRGVPAKTLVVLNASVTETAKEESNRWLPKTGAAFFQTKGVELYAPHGKVRITAATDYIRALPVGVMFTLGFSD